MIRRLLAIAAALERLCREARRAWPGWIGRRCGTGSCATGGAGRLVYPGDTNAAIVVCALYLYSRWFSGTRAITDACCKALNRSSPRLSALCRRSTSNGVDVCEFEAETAYLRS